MKYLLTTLTAIVAFGMLAVAVLPQLVVYTKITFAGRARLAILTLPDVFQTTAWLTATVDTTT